jgi:hypothetical protein
VPTESMEPMSGPSVIELLVQNHPGVMVHVASLFATRDQSRVVRAVRLAHCWSYRHTKGECRQNIVSLRARSRLESAPVN